MVTQFVYALSAIAIALLYVWNLFYYYNNYSIYLSFSNQMQDHNFFHKWVIW